MITFDQAPSFQDVPPFTRKSVYAVDISWSRLLPYVEESVKDYKLDLEPDFQRAHVWTMEQKSRFVEYCLRGGESARQLYFNCPGWNYGNADGPYVVVDGKQRLNAAMGFLKDEVKAFGWKCSEYSGVLDPLKTRFRWNVNDLETRAEVLQWYLDLNTGGTIHTSKEIAKVLGLLDAEVSRGIKPNIGTLVEVVFIDAESDADMEVGDIVQVKSVESDGIIVADRDLRYVLVKHGHWRYATDKRRSEL